MELTNGVTIPHTPGGGGIAVVQRTPCALRTFCCNRGGAGALAVSSLPENSRAGGHAKLDSHDVVFGALVFTPRTEKRSLTALLLWDAADKGR
jgi:hypothetical protein